jgi:hypothetical protein
MPTLKNGWMTGGSAPAGLELDSYTLVHARSA